MMDVVYKAAVYALRVFGTSLVVGAVRTQLTAVSKSFGVERVALEFVVMAFMTYMWAILMMSRHGGEGRTDTRLVGALTVGLLMLAEFAWPTGTSSMPPRALQVKWSSKNALPMTLVAAYCAHLLLVALFPTWVASPGEPAAPSSSSSSDGQRRQARKQQERRRVGQSGRAQAEKEAPLTEEKKDK